MLAGEVTRKDGHLRTSVQQYRMGLCILTDVMVPYSQKTEASYTTDIHQVMIVVIAQACTFESLKQEFTKSPESEGRELRAQ